MTKFVPLEPDWIDQIPRETLLKLVDIGSGHSIVPSDVYLDAGMPQKIVDHFTVIHKSKRVPTEKLIDLVRGTIDQVLTAFQIEKIDTQDNLEFYMEELTDEITNSIAEHGFKDILEMVNYDHKETIFTNGVIVDELKGVYSLDLLEAIVRTLKLPVEDKMGRGFRYTAANKAIKTYLDIEKSTK